MAWGQVECYFFLWSATYFPLYWGRSLKTYQLIVKFKLLSYWISVATSIQCSQIFGRHCMMVFIMTKYIDSEYVEIMNTCKRWMFCDPQKHSKKSTGSSDPSTSLAPHSYICLFVSCFCLFVCWWSTFTKSFRWMFTWSTNIFQQICTESKVLASSY